MKYEDQTKCDPSQLSCVGHHYKVSAPDIKWLSTAGVISRQVFCMRTTASASAIAPQAAAGSKPNLPQPATTKTNPTTSQTISGQDASLHSNTSLKHTTVSKTTRLICEFC
jgi:hypothetical protein